MITELGLLDTIEKPIINNGCLVVTEENKKININYKKGTRRIVSKIGIKVSSDKMVSEISAVWDTGASMSFINESLARKLNLTPIDTGKTVTVNGISDAVYYIVDVVLSHDIIFKNLKVCATETNRKDIEFIIGMDIISKGNFSLKNYSNELIMEYEYIG